jgi:hypothetical protein
VCGVTLHVDEAGFVVGEVSPEQHAWLAAVRFQGVKGWELVNVPAPAPSPPQPNIPALVVETLAPDLTPEPALVAPASDTKTQARKRGRT